MFNMQFPPNFDLNIVSKITLIKWIREHVRTWDGHTLCLTSSKALAELVLDAYKKGKQA